jgi:hypothetical protein
LQRRYRDYKPSTVGDLAFELASTGKSVNPSSGTPCTSSKKKFRTQAQWSLGGTGKMCCQGMVAKAHDIRPTMWAIAKAAVRRGDDGYPRKMGVTKKEAFVLNECCQWWEQHVKIHGCSMPERGEILINNIPWSNVYEHWYCTECEDAETEAASYTTWDNARKARFGDCLVKRKKKRGLSKCVICAELDRMWDNAKDAEYPKNERMMCKRLKLEHNDWQGAERKVYYHRKAKCRADPTCRCSSIDDGMGNQCTHMPFLGVRMASDVAKLDRMKWKVQTLLLHGVGLDFWLVPPWVKDDNNMQLTCWVRSMMAHHGSQWPAVVYRQMDGSSVNVNSVNFGVMAALVGSGQCQKMCCSRLPPGHTHEDVDGTHSVIACHFEGKGAVSGCGTVETVGSFEGMPTATAQCRPMDEAIKDAFAKDTSSSNKATNRCKLQPNVKVCWCAWDFNKWMDGCVSEKFSSYAKRNPEKCYALDDEGDLVDVMERKVARDFKFVHQGGVPGDVKFFYKDWMQDELWLPVKKVSSSEAKEESGEVAGDTNADRGATHYEAA